MPRTMYDSTSPYDIPQGVQMVAGYVDGAYAWPGAGWKFHDSSVHVTIACFASTLNANVLDVEAGCATIYEAAQWLKYHVSFGRWKVLYYSRSLFGSLHAAVLAAGVGDDQWGTWVADWNGVPDVPPGAIAHQYANPTLSGGHYDLSAVADYWPGVDAAPQPPAPAPAPPTGVDGVRAAWSGLGGFLVNGLPAAISEIGAVIGRIRSEI